MKNTISLLCLNFILLSLGAQNLVPDHSFEQLDCPDNTIASFTQMGEWYVTGADAYWMHLNCDVNPDHVASIVAIDLNLEPNMGFGYVSIEGVLSNNGFFSTEGVATRLKKTLKKDHYYFFEMAFLNFDTSNFNSNYKIEDCTPFPEHFLDVRLSSARIEVDIISDLSVSPPRLTDIQVGGQSRLLNKIAAEPGFKKRRWRDYWDCFLAEGGEQHLSIVGNNYQVKENHPCINEDVLGITYSFGHAVDDIYLIELPFSIDTSMVYCGTPIDFHLRSLVKDPILKRASFLWADGSTEKEKTFTEPGLYTAEMILPCTRIPININIDGARCTNKVFVPNAFSPNGDGVNDEFKVFLNTKLDLQNFHLLVYNRWGSLVFESKELNQGWNGRLKNIDLPSGVYFWVLQYEAGLEQKAAIKNTQKGEVLLMR